jgi:hypothetical protein
MEPEYRVKLDQWFLEEVQRLRARGLTDDLLQEPSVREGVYKASLRRHHAEILADPGLISEMLLESLQAATPADLRHMAKADREDGLHESANKLEWLAGLLDGQSIE